MAFRSRVLAAFKNIHKARKEVFDGDMNALSVTRQRINEEFRKHSEESDPAKIEESLTLATDVALLLRTTVVQCRQKDEDTYEVRLTKNTKFQENTMFDPLKELPINRRRKKCSDDQSSS